MMENKEDLEQDPDLWKNWKDHTFQKMFEENIVQMTKQNSMRTNSSIFIGENRLIYIRVTSAHIFNLWIGFTLL